MRSYSERLAEIEKIIKNIFDVISGESAAIDSAKKGK